MRMTLNALNFKKLIYLKDNTFVDQIFVDTYKQANVSSDNLPAQNLRCIESSIKQLDIIGQLKNK